MMGGNYTRRAMLTAAPALVATGIISPSNASSGSQIMTLYKQWRVARDAYNHADVDKPTHGNIYARMSEIEEQIWPLPCTTAAEIAAKFDVQTDCRGLCGGERFADECRAVLASVGMVDVRNHGHKGTCTFLDSP